MQIKPLLVSLCSLRLLTRVFFLFINQDRLLIAQSLGFKTHGFQVLYAMLNSTDTLLSTYRILIYMLIENVSDPRLTRSGAVCQGNLYNIHAIENVLDSRLPRSGAV